MKFALVSVSSSYLFLLSFFFALLLLQCDLLPYRLKCFHIYKYILLAQKVTGDASHLVSDQCPSIHLAAQHGDDEAVLRFIKTEGVDVNSKLNVSISKQYL
jgi:hypothetical protein